jgi:CPA2 family monovalent cation:H+ antiporter-2
VLEAARRQHRGARPRAPARVALPLAGSLAQIGEFSFVLSGLGVSLGLIPVADRQLLLAAALVAITLNPVVVRALAAAGDRAAQRDYVRPDAPGEAPPEPAPGLAGHAVLVGFGRVGATVGAALAALGIPVVVAERDRRAGDARGRWGCTSSTATRRAQGCSPPPGWPAPGCS